MAAPQRTVAELHRVFETIRAQFITGDSFKMAAQNKPEATNHANPQTGFSQIGFSQTGFFQTDVPHIGDSHTRHSHACLFFTRSSDFSR
jgi:hypothetical protein